MSFRISFGTNKLQCLFSSLTPIYNRSANLSPTQYCNLTPDKLTCYHKILFYSILYYSILFYNIDLMYIVPKSTINFSFIFKNLCGKPQILTNNNIFLRNLLKLSIYYTIVWYKRLSVKNHTFMTFCSLIYV